MLNQLLALDWVEVLAICDIKPNALAATQEIIKKHGRKEASEYGKDELDYFAEAVRDKKQTPIDVYESVLMSCVVALSGNSIASGSKPVKVPDFTRGI